MLLTGEPEAGVKVTQHVFVLARLPDVVDGVGQLLPLYSRQLFLLLRGERHVGGRVPRVRSRGLWMEKEVTESQESSTKGRKTEQEVYESRSRETHSKATNSDINPQVRLKRQSV